MSRIIAIFGQKQTGKSTLARLVMNDIYIKYLQRCDKTEYSLYRWRMVGFADAVKKTLDKLCPLPRINDTETAIEAFDRLKETDTILPGWKVTVREAARILGDSLRQVKERVWIDKVLKPYTIVYDGRYRNEAEAVREAGGRNILIIRPSHMTEDSHPSEKWVGDLYKLWYGHKSYYQITGREFDTSQISAHASDLNMFDAIVINDSDLRKLGRYTNLSNFAIED